MSQEERPLILFDPFPRSRDLIFTEALWRDLAGRARIVGHEDGRMPAALVERHIGEAELVIGQTDLPAERIDAAPRLKAIINVEGNFLPNVDYAACFRRGIQVLAAAPAFAGPVAEMGLAMALDLARGVTAADRAFRNGEERYGLAGNGDAFTLSGCDIGFVGFGNLGRALQPLLAPFRPRIRVFDPWLPDGHLREFGVPARDARRGAPRLPPDLRAGRRHVGKSRHDRQRRAGGDASGSGARPSVAGRCGRLERADGGDVGTGASAPPRMSFRQEPVAPDDPVRRNPNLLLSAHRAGGMREAFHRIGEMVVDDALLILAGLPAVRLQAARPETVGRLRSRPGRSYGKGEI